MVAHHSSSSNLCPYITRQSARIGRFVHKGAHLHIGAHAHMHFASLMAAWYLLSHSRFHTHTHTDTHIYIAQSYVSFLLGLAKPPRFNPFAGVEVAKEVALFVVAATTVVVAVVVGTRPVHRPVWPPSESSGLSQRATNAVTLCNAAPVQGHLISLLLKRENTPTLFLIAGKPLVLSQRELNSFPLAPIAFSHSY